MYALALRRLAASLGFLAVALGAFGAHGLQPRLEALGSVATWQTAVFYHFTHALALLCLSQSSTPERAPALCFTVGVGLFSGSLYFYALTRLRWLAIVTPFGGLFLLVGWAWLLGATFRRRA